MSGVELAVILAAGRGTRMQAGAEVLPPEQRPEAEAGRKMMIPIAGRPFLSWVLDAVADAGVTEACVVIGPTTADLPGRLDAKLSLTFATQREPRGTADAVLAARPVVGDRSFLVLNGDNWYPPAALRALRTAPPPATIGFRSGRRDAAYALMRAGPDGCLEEIVEKPDAATRERLGGAASVSMTCWSFTPAVFDACRHLEPSVRGELELPDAVRRLAADTCVRVVAHEGPVLDLTGPTDVAEIARRLAP